MKKDSWERFLSEDMEENKNEETEERIRRLYDQIGEEDSKCKNCTASEDCNERESLSSSIDLRALIFFVLVTSGLIGKKKD